MCVLVHHFKYHKGVEVNMAFPLFWVGAAAAAAAAAGIGKVLLSPDDKDKQIKVVVKDAPQTPKAKASSKKGAYNQQHIDAFLEAQADCIDQEKNIAALKRIEAAQQATYQRMQEEKMAYLKEQREAMSSKQELKQTKTEIIKKEFTDDQKKAKNLQDILASLRTIAGYTSEGMATRLGFSRATLSGLENGSTTMTVAQYYALVAFLAFNKGLESLVQHTVIMVALDALVENRDNFTEQQRSKIKLLLDQLAMTVRVAEKTSNPTGSREVINDYTDRILEIHGIK